MLNYRIRKFQIKIPESYFVDIGKLILKILWNASDSTMLKKNNNIWGQFQSQNLLWYWEKNNQDCLKLAKE